MLSVVFEDEWVLAVDKPAGILVHGDGTGARTLTDEVRGLLAARGRADVAPFCQPVQRLDVDTTGLVLFSLAKAVQPALDAQVAGHDMRKRYLAEVRGSFAWDSRDIEAPLGRDRHDARRMRVCRAGQGKPALTHVRLLAERGGRSLLLVELGSGRRHQIRVHLSHLGFPIVGDALYGGGRSRGGLMLHAWSEDLVHPVTGERLHLQTAWPDRFGEPVEA